MDYIQFQCPGKKLATYGLELIENTVINKFIIVLIDLENSVNISVTNCVEHLATHVLKECLPKSCNSDDIYWFEHYEKGTWPVSSGYDLVTMKWDGVKYCAPQWVNYKANDFEVVKNNFIKKGGISL